MRILFIAILALCQLAHAQSQQFEMKGSLGKNTAANKPIEFTLNWSEKDGLAEGTYKDNFYTQSAKLKGISGDHGRIFVVTLPKEKNGVRTISFLASDLSGKKGKALIPVSIVLRDNNGNPVTTTSIDANLIAMSNVVAQRQVERECTEGFGALAGFCGEYNGMISEELDTQKKCNLLSFNDARMIFDQNAELGIVLGEPSNILNPPVHRIGRILANTTSTRVDVLSRNCRPLPGTEFPGDNCKRLNLSGSFTIENNNKHFTGVYTITDERTSQSCRYSLSMDLSE